MFFWELLLIFDGFKYRNYNKCVCVFAQGVFDHRMKTWQKWQDSQMLLQKKREAEAKLQFTNKPDKLQQAKDEIKEVRRSFCETSSPKITFTMIEMTKYPIFDIFAHLVIKTVAFFFVCFFDAMIFRLFHHHKWEFRVWKHTHTVSSDIFVLPHKGTFYSPTISFSALVSQLYFTY